MLQCYNKFINFSFIFRFRITVEFKTGNDFIITLLTHSLVPRRSDCFSCAKYCCVYDAGCRARPEHEREAWSSTELHASRSRSSTLPEAPRFPFVFRPRATSRVVHATVFRARKAIRAPGDEAGSRIKLCQFARAKF